MTEVSNLCDLPIKKKKKKKVFDLNNDLGTERGVDGVKDQTLDIENPGPLPELETLDDGNLDLNFGQEKKNQKKVTINLDDLKSTLPDISSTIENVEIEGDDMNEPLVLQDGFDLDIDFSKTKKKKRKKKEIDELVAEETDKKSDKLDDTTECENHTWFGSDRDYTYDELLTRAFDIMREKNPDMVGGKKQKFIMRPPQVVRVGSKKTSFVNFTEICKSLHRLPKHLLDFLLAELGTSGSVDGNNQFIIKGRFQQKQIENLLRRYIKEYVTCHSCRSPDTILQKDNRLYFLQCETCSSRCSVASIKSGFQAVTGKRAAIRAKTE